MILFFDKLCVELRVILVNDLYSCGFECSEMRFAQINVEKEPFCDTNRQGRPDILQRRCENQISNRCNLTWGGRQQSGTIKM